MKPPALADWLFTKLASEIFTKSFDVSRSSRRMGCEPDCGTGARCSERWHSTALLAEAGRPRSGNRIARQLFPEAGQTE